MLDLSADNRDGFEDTDGQLYTSNSFYLFASYTCSIMKGRYRRTTRSYMKMYKMKGITECRIVP